MAIDTAAKRYSAIHVGSPWRGPAVRPDGSVSADARLALVHLYGGIAAEAPVEVPDVVGLPQAAATLALETAGFVVVVTTATSSVVAAGFVISQQPEGGDFAALGSTVTIVVSTGEISVLDAKFQGYPNVLVRGLKRDEDEEPELPLPAEITNMPDGPPVPLPVDGLVARGLDLALLDTPPEPADVDLAVDTPQITVKPRAPAVPEAKPAEEVVEASQEPAPEVAKPEPEPEPLTAEAVRAELVDLVADLQVQLAAAKVQAERALAEIVALRAQIKKDRDLAALNRKRAAEITRKMLKGD